MNTSILLPHHLYSTTSGQIDVAQLQKLGEQYPYSSVVQFYLLAGMKEQSTSKHWQAAKTALLFPNTNWLDWQLHLFNDSVNAWDQHVQTSSRWDNILVGSVATDIKALSSKEQTFEPLHVVDYFASQGITITENEAADKLGKQLKSFTEWLKTMKKIQPVNLEASTDPADQRIQNIAESSNDESNVITEAMANVLEKQGKINKAIEIYQKLSLNNPAKSAYFAAKIDSLKGS